MTPHDYWVECVANALEEAGVSATSEQIAAIAGDVLTGHECYGMAFYVPENPVYGELEAAKKALAVERDRVSCPACGGRGSIVEDGGVRSCTMRCWKCDGDGKVASRDAYIRGAP